MRKERRKKGMKSSSLNEEEETCGNEVLQIMGKLGRTEILSFTREKRKGAGGEKVSSWRNFLVKFIPQGSFVFIVEFALTFSLPFSLPSSFPNNPFLAENRSLISTIYPPEFSRRADLSLYRWRTFAESRGEEAPGAGIDRSLSGRW